MPSFSTGNTLPTGNVDNLWGFPARAYTHDGDGAIGCFHLIGSWTDFKVGADSLRSLVPDNATFGVTTVSMEARLSPTISCIDSDGVPIHVSISYDAGATWSAEQNIALISADFLSFTLDFPPPSTDSGDNYSDANFRVRVEAGGEVFATELDYIEVSVAWSTPDPAAPATVTTSYAYLWINEVISGEVLPEVAAKIAKGDHRFMHRE